MTEARNFDGLSLRKVISRDDIEKATSELARRISEDYGEKVPVLVCVLRSARPLFEEIVRKVTVSVEECFIECSSYGGGTRPGRVRLVSDVGCPLEGRDVVIVDDIVDTSETARFLVGHLGAKNPRSLMFCALIDKTKEGERHFCPDYSCFRVEENEGFLVGYGMDYMDRGRKLPDIYAFVGEPPSDAARISGLGE